MALLETLQDNFNDNSFNSTLWLRSSATEVLEQNQHLELRLSTASKYIRSQSTYDMTGSYFQFKLDAVTVFNLVAGVGVQVGTPTPAPIGGDKFLFNFNSSSQFRATMIVGGTGTYSANTAIGSYKYFRIKEAGGSIYWDVSADGLSWTNIRTEVNPLAIGAMSVFAISSFIFTSGNQRLFIDDVNIPAPQPLTVPLLSNSNTLYSQTVAPDQNLSLPLISNTNTLYSHSVIPGVVQLSPPLISSTETLYPPEVLGNTLFPPLINSVAQLFAPTLQTGPVSIQLPFITDTNTLYAQTIAPDQDLLLPLISSPSQLFAPTMQPGAVNLNPPLLSNVNDLYPPSLILGPAQLTLPLISNVNQLYAFEVRRAGLLELPFILNQNQFFDMTVFMRYDPLVVPGIKIDEPDPIVQIFTEPGRIREMPGDVDFGEVPVSALTDDPVVLTDDPNELSGGSYNYSVKGKGEVNITNPEEYPGVVVPARATVSEDLARAHINKIREDVAEDDDAPRIQSAGFTKPPAGSIVVPSGQIVNQQNSIPGGRVK